MGEPNDKIGIKEYTTIAIFLIGIKTADDVPAIIFDSLKNAGWIGVLISGLVAALPLFLLMHIAKKYQSKSLIDMIHHLFGKYIGFFILFFLWAIGFFYIVLDTATYTDIISTMYYTNTPPIVLYAILVGVAAYGAKKGLEQIGSVSWSIFPYVQASLLFAIVLTIGQGNFDFIFPVFGPGEWELMKESVMKVSIYVDFLYLFILFPYVKSTKDFKKGTWIAFVIIVFNLAISMASYVMLFDYNAVMSLNYPFHEAIRSISLGFLSSLETLFFPFWLIAAFLKFAIYFYINILLFGKIFRIKHFEYVIPSFAVLILFLGLIPESPTFTILHMKELIGKILSPMFFFLPIIMWVLAKFKGDLNK